MCLCPFLSSLPQWSETCMAPDPLLFSIDVTFSWNIIVSSWNMTQLYRFSSVPLWENQRLNLGLSRATDFENKLVITTGDRWEGGMDWGLGLAYTHSGVWDGQWGPALKSRKLYSVFCDYVENESERVVVYVYNWITFWYSRNDHKIANQTLKMKKKF